jgi:hypothetical protein
MAYRTTIVKKVTFFETHCHWKQDMDLLLCSRKQMPEYGMETSNIASQKDIQNSTISRESDVDTFFRCRRASFGPLARGRHNVKHSPLQ